MTRPSADLAVESGRQQPEPPLPEPEPPQPIPPPEPIPLPEPPRAAVLQWPPVGAYPGEPGFDEPATLPLGATQPIETGWHQPPATEPWHAQHERAGEWQHEAPEHLAFEHSPLAEVEPGVQAHQIATLPPTHAPPDLPAEPARRSGLWVSAALVVTLLLCGGGATSALLLLRNGDSGKGAPDPATAVNRFMTAVYTEQDASAAGDVVCREARDQKRLDGRISQIKTYAAEYDDPSFRWNDPSVSGQSDDQATVAVQLTMSTDDEKQAQQELTFTVVHKTGWLVCDIAG